MKVKIENEMSLVPAEIVENPEKQALEAQLAEVTKKVTRKEKGFAQLEAILERDFTPEKIKQYILELCEANDIKLTRDGDTFEAPNWDARKNGLDRVLALLRYTKNNEATIREHSPAKIVFNIVNTVPKEPK